MWGSVCNPFGDWTPENSKVVCRQLGFNDEGSIINYYAETSIFTILTYTEPLLLDYNLDWFGTNKKAVIGDVHCVGMEKELLECSHASIGSHYCGRLSHDEYANGSDIVISCYGTNMGTVVLNSAFMRNI